MSNEIRFISLQNKGGFTVKMRINGGSKEYNMDKYFPVGQEKTMDLANAVGKIKDGDEVWLEAVVKWGKNNKAKQRFIYRKSSARKAKYTISGTTLDNTMKYSGIVDEYTMVSTPVRAISLSNNGGFVAQIRIKGDFGSYTVNQDICVKQEKTLDLKEAVGKIKDGDVVWLETVVKAGYYNEGRQRFVYRQSSTQRARYTISGTTLNNSLTYNGIESYFTRVSEPVRFVSLKNDGGFVARIRVHGDFGSRTINNDICVCQERRVDLSTCGVREGDEVWLEAVVVGGSYKTGKERFIYRKSSDNRICYSISGSTLINSLHYNDVCKVGVVPAVAPSDNEITKKINDWTNDRKTACAWPGIEKNEIVDGLNILKEHYFSSNGYRNGVCYTGIDQGRGFPTCGAVAAMFALARLNFGTFVDVVIDLYETGSLMGYKVPVRLRNLESKENKVEEKYKCTTAGISNVCWMFQGSLAQKESIFDVKLDDLLDSDRNIKMHTRFEEMADNVDFMFNATNVKKQKLINWSTTAKAKNNLAEWERCLNNSGTILWEMHSDGLNNAAYNKNSYYNHVDLVDLHWVVVTRIERSAQEVTLDMHSWGKIYRITISYDEFQKMAYSALLFESR